MKKINPLFEVKNISRNFLKPDGTMFHALEKVDLALYPNEVVAIIGPSGCGKSTLLRVIAGLIPPTKGEIIYHGKKLQGLMPDISMIFQNFALYPWMTVQENIEVALKAVHASTAEIKSKTAEAIAIIGLDGFEEAYPRELSGGMKQRVGIARALVRNPEMLFMDEAFSNLDTFIAEGLRNELIQIFLDKTWRVQSILLVSHNIYEVAYMADRIVFMQMNPGKIHAVLKNKMARPRNYQSPEFNHFVKQLHDMYGQMSSKS